MPRRYMKKLVVLLFTFLTISCGENRTLEGDSSVYKASLYPNIEWGEDSIYVAKYSDLQFFKQSSMKKIGEYFNEKGSEYLNILALSKKTEKKSDISWKNSKNVIFTNINQEPCKKNVDKIILFSNIQYSKDGTFAYFTQRKLCTGTSDNEATIITLRKDKVSCTDLNLGINLCTDWVRHSQVYINGI